MLPDRHHVRAHNHPPREGMNEAHSATVLCSALMPVGACGPVRRPWNAWALGLGLGLGLGLWLGP